MSRFFSEKFAGLTAYTPGEQPKDRRYIKLNTNESPYAPPISVVEAARKATENAQLYCDPTCSVLVKKLAEQLDVAEDMVLPTNGSDEILNFAFMAFCDKNTPVVFPDISYGFYSVFAKLHNIPYRAIPLKEDFSIDYRDYINAEGMVVIANPNAPTGMSLTIEEVEKIVVGNPNNVVVIDEAYVDFGGESCIPLIKKYKNLLVTGTFSKSRSMAGARLGFGVACQELIADLNTIKYSTNPYNVNSMTMAAGIAMLEDEETTKKNCATIMENRAYAAEEMKKLGFLMTDSKTNFLFAMHPEVDGGEIYGALRERGILVRHFTAPRIAAYNRITVGSREEMEALVIALKEILEEKQ